MSRNDNRGFYNQGAHPCFLDLRKKYIKPRNCALNEVCSGHMRACVCVCACVSQPTSLNGVEEVSGWGSVRGEVVAAPGTVLSQIPRKDGTSGKATEGAELEWN